MKRLFSTKPRLAAAAILTICAHITALFMMMSQKDISQPPSPPQTVSVAFKTLTKPEPPKPVIVPPKVQPKPQPKKVTKKPARKKLVKKKIIRKKPVQKKPIKKTPVKKTPPKKIVTKPVQKTVPAPAVQKPAPVTKPAPKTAKPKTGNKSVRLISKKLDYPRSARSRGQEDTVYVRILVGKDGRPKDIKMHKPSRFAKLNMGAMKTARSMRFAPAIQNGQKVEQWVTVPIQFKLQ